MRFWPRRRGERPAAEPGPSEAAERDREQRLHELVRLVVRVGPGVEPDRHAVLDARDHLVDEGRPGEEERHPADDEDDARRRDVEHPEEDPEVEKPRAEVVRLHEHGHRAAPDQEQRAEVLQPSLREHLALLAQVAREEHDQQDLRELARLDAERPELDPEARAADLLADARQRGQHEQRERDDPDHVLVRLEPPVVVAERDERRREERDADHDPQPLAERVVGIQAVDLGQADRRQQSRHRAADTDRRTAPSAASRRARRGRRAGRTPRR